MADLRIRLEEALYAADLFGLTSAPTPDRIAALVMHVLGEVAGEWEDAAGEFYYAHRHTGPIDYADGFESGWQHAASLLRDKAAEPLNRDWS